MDTAKKYSVGLIVGRFQPFHLGHLYLLKEALTYAETIVVAIGSIEKHDAQNPLSFEVREHLLRQVLKKEGLEQRVRQIVPIQDYPSDEQWVRELEKVVGPFQAVYGNNDWTNRVLQDAGYDAVVIPDVQRDQYQGTVIRQAAKRAEKWQESVPSYLVDEISTHL